MEESTEIFGIPVPSTDPTFLSFVVVHILISLVAVVSGLVAMLSDKGRGRHSTYGKVYFWSMLSSFCTVIILSVMRWPYNIHLLSIGTFAIGFAMAGYWFAKNQRIGWTRLHTICMGASYILLMTVFYVDNGKNLPFWRLFPQWFFWAFPSVVGIPIVFWALLKHRLNERKTKV